MRPRLVSRLVGFLLAQQDAESSAPVARVRRCLKQGADVVLKVGQGTRFWFVVIPKRH